MTWKRNRRTRRDVMRAATARLARIGVTLDDITDDDIGRAGLTPAQRAWLWTEHGFDLALRSFYQPMMERALSQRVRLYDHLRMR